MKGKFYLFKKNNYFSLKTLLVMSMFFIFANSSLFVTQVYAASLTSLSDVQTNQTTGQLSSHTISFTTPSGITTGQTITLTFDNSTSISASLATADLYLSVGGVSQTVNAGSNGATIWGFVRTSSTVITITAPSSGTPASASSAIVIKIGAVSGGTDRITNGSVGTTNLTIAGTMADTGTIAEPVLSNSTVTVTATVAPTITFSLSGNSIGFGTLSSSVARYATADGLGSGSDTSAHTAAVSTNAPSGFSLSFIGDTLRSGSNSISAIGTTAQASNPGNPQFGIYATESGGSNVSVSSRYNDNATPKFAYGASTSTADTLGSGTSNTATATFAIHYIANISGATVAGTYTTNINYIATGNF